jgi:hypothetical protein
VKIPREELAEIIAGRKASAAEVDAMARELLDLRDEEAKRDDGTVAVLLEHVGKPTQNGWFSPRRGRMSRAQCHVGARVSLAGRIYGVVAIEGDKVLVR